MSDAFNFDPSLTGSAGEFGGQVGGYNIGPQPEFTTTPVSAPQTFAATETGYTPTFDFSSFMPYVPPSTGYSQAGGGVSFDPYAFPQTGGASTVPTSFAGPTTQPSFEQMQPIYQAAGQPLPSIVGQFAGPQGADATSGLYDTSGISGAPTAPQQDKAGFFQSLLGKGFSAGDALKLALGLGGGIMGMNAQKKAADEAAAAEAEYKAAAAKAAGQYSGLAQPYLNAGGSQLAMALQGSLAPAQMQQLQAAQAQGNLGATQNATDLANVNAQAGLGATQRGITSEGIAADQAAFNAARQQPYTNLQFEQSMLNGLPITATNYTSLQPSTLTSAAQGATTVNGLLNNLGLGTTPATTAPVK